MDPEVKFLMSASQMIVKDVVQTAEYYRDILGFKILGYFLDPPVFAMVQRDNVEIHFGKSDSDSSSSNREYRKIASDVYVWVTEIDKLYEELQEKKADILEGPTKRVYNCTEITVRDCNGYIIIFGA